MTDTNLPKQQIAFLPRLSWNLMQSALILSCLFGGLRSVGYGLLASSFCGLHGRSGKLVSVLLSLPVAPFQATGHNRASGPPNVPAVAAPLASVLARLFRFQLSVALSDWHAGQG
jgi:hypothetical protein